MVAVDLSKWQGVIPSSLFALWWNSGVKHFILKAGGGDDDRYKDSCWDVNLSNAIHAGVPLSALEAYWFNGTTDPVQDAIFLRSYVPGGMRVWADVEHEGTMPSWNPDQLTAFARTLEGLAYRVGAYMSTSVTYEFNWSAVAAWLPLWVADYRGVSFPPVAYWSRSQVVYWQYTSSGTLPGYPGRLDLDYDYNPETSPAAANTPSFLTLEDKTMLYIQHAISGSIAVIFPWMNNGHGAYRHVTAPEWAAAVAAGAKYAALSDADWGTIMTGMTPVSGVVGQ